MFCGTCCSTWRVGCGEGQGESQPCLEHLASRSSFEGFPGVQEPRLPIVLFSDDARQQLVWHRGSVVDGRVVCPLGAPDVWNADPVSMSPAYLGFAVEPSEKRYLHYGGVGILFSRPLGGRFMQPSIDTVLVCLGLEALFGESCSGFSDIVDVGAGSGFIGKFAAMKAPGEGTVRATLVDIDPAAEDYASSPGFGASARSLRGRGIAWRCRTGDGAELLKSAAFDLVISNPPYIPAPEEAQNEAASQPSGFWEGCGLLVRLLELFLERRDGAHLVLMLTSLTLKSRRARQLLEEAPQRGLRVRQLLEREIAWKAYYAGRGGCPPYLLASEGEREQRRRIGDCSYFVGCTRPGDSRQGGDRDRLFGYHWHVAYVLDICAAP